MCLNKTRSEIVLGEGPETVRNGPLGCRGMSPTDVPAMDSFRRDLSALLVSHAHSHVTTYNRPYSLAAQGTGFI